ncbi:MAG: hypothetical protein K8W52_12660 [Deltaproteobacteria bacterium]|nr:hypothetical protein [Deltaproteobacteria bacterium]
MTKLRTRGLMAVAGVVLGAGAAQAGDAPWVDPTNATVKYVPPGHLTIAIVGSTHFWGGLTYSEEGTGLSYSDSTQVTESGKVSVAYEVYEGIELGAAVRYAPSIKYAGVSSSNREVDVFGRVAFHVRPWNRLDLAFVADLGRSSIHEADAAVPDPTGFVMDLQAGVSYPLGAGLFGVTALGYQRGFQNTTTESIPGQPEPTTYTTDFMHFDVGLAYRFL